MQYSFCSWLWLYWCQCRGYFCTHAWQFSFGQCCPLKLSRFFNAMSESLYLSKQLLYYKYFGPWECMHGTMTNPLNNVLCQKEVVISLITFVVLRIPHFLYWKLGSNESRFLIDVGSMDSVLCIKSRQIATVWNPFRNLVLFARQLMHNILISQFLNEYYYSFLHLSLHR